MQYDGKEFFSDPRRKLKLWNDAQALLMTGPRATRPTARAVRKTMRRLAQGKLVKGSWRSWPSN
jgi:hypothetical protein